MKSLEQEHPSVSVDDIKRLRAVWFSMRKRCGLPGSPSYDRYGARGIYVCEAWEALAEFVRWALQHGYSRGLTLDRIDNNGPYSPENCRWATDFEQARNKRTNRWVTAWGEEKVMTDWLSDPRCQVKRSCLKARLDNGWGPEEAISTPPRGVRLRDKPLGH